MQDEVTHEKLCDGCGIVRGGPQKYWCLCDYDEELLTDFTRVGILAAKAMETKAVVLAAMEECVLLFQKDEAKLRAELEKVTRERDDLQSRLDYVILAHLES